MNISAGLVGLPNVGKSTLFNALTRSSVPAENYPFCTIDPHVACTSVPDPRVLKLQQAYKSQKLIPSTVQFVDIAGLVKGASSGEGLGNQFLSHIREVDLILHVLRCFDDPNITYSRAEDIDPLVDYDIIMTELMLKDIDSVEKRIAKATQLMKSNKSNPAAQKELALEIALLEELNTALNALNVAKTQELLAQATITTIPLLSAKNFLIIANVSEDEMTLNEFTKNTHYQALIQKFGANRVIPVSAKLEYDLTLLNEHDKEEMLQMLKIDHDGLASIISQTYTHLGLITFFTCGPKEIHAWPIPKGLTIRQAAGEIHSDLERGFIFADIFNCEDLFSYGTEAKLKEIGKIRTEGQDYKVQDGDVVHIKFNV
ncbi:redox-regulated ATPase YchF [Candidatus Dependentiae bacterium]|nr:redox-regulated ATPase YchF [Candidatus Dependentiae bacterium]